MLKTIQKYETDKQILDRWVAKLKLCNIQVSINYEYAIKAYPSKPWSITKYDVSLLNNISIVSIKLPQLKYGAVFLSSELEFNIVVNRDAFGIADRRIRYILDYSKQSYEKLEFDEIAQVNTNTSYRGLVLISTLNSLINCYKNMNAGYNFTIKVDINTLIKPIEQILNNKDMGEAYKFEVISKWVQLRIHHDKVVKYCFEKYKNIVNSISTKIRQIRIIEIKLYTVDKSKDYYEYKIDTTETQRRQLLEKFNQLFSLFTSNTSDTLNLSDNELWSKAEHIKNKIITNLGSILTYKQAKLSLREKV
jgi:hypothetical protein